MQVSIWCRTLLPVVFLGMGINAAASGIFQETFSAHYVVESHGTLIANTYWSLSKNGNDLVYETETKTAGLAALITNDHIVERSEWRIKDHSPRPHTYRYHRTGGRKDKQVTVAFDWVQRVALNTAKGQTWSMPVPDGTLDKLGYVIAMMYDLDIGKREFEYPVADGGKLKTYRLKAIGEEDLETRIGTLATIKIRRIRDTDKRETILWCAPQLHYLPVKVQHREPDGTITFKIQSVQGIPADSAS